MKLLVVSTPIFKFGPTGVAGYSGLEHLAWQQAVGLAKRGHQVAIICPEGSVVPGCQVVGIPEFIYKDNQQIRVDETIAYDRTWQLYPQFDCIIDNSWTKSGYLLKMEGKLKTPILGWLHAPANTMFSTLPPVEKPCFVCISQDQCNHFESLFSPARSRVCANGIDLDYYQPLGIPRTDRFLFLARFSSIKGPDIALRVCEQTGVPLDLIGDTQITNEPELIRQCMAMADGVRVKVHGNKSRGECVYFFSQAHALLHPTQRFREPAGLAPREAMACGTPVCAWRYGAMPESILPGETGWLVDSEQEMADIVREIAKPGAITDAMRRRCREWVADNFSLERMVGRVEALCREAMDGGW